jgi:hypothetical protein
MDRLIPRHGFDVKKLDLTLCALVIVITAATAYQMGLNANQKPKVDEVTVEYIINSCLGQGFFGYGTDVFSCSDSGD